MNNKNIPEDTIEQYINGDKLTEIQQQQLDTWLAEDRNNQLYFDEITRKGRIQELARGFAQFNPLSIDQKLNAKIKKQAGIQKVMRIGYSVAAAVLAFSIGLYIYKVYTHVPAKENDTAWKMSTNLVRLTLPDNQIFYLDSMRPGLLDTLNGISIVLTEDSGLALGLMHKSGNRDYPGYITLAIPAERTRTVTFPDGTTATLNASSKIRIPLGYAAGKREIEMEGDVFYTVVEDKDHPFKVSADNAVVEVLGTSFEVRAYPDEKRVRTEVSTGSVRLIAAQHDTVIKEGHAFQFYTDHSASSQMMEISADSVGVWRRGVLDFTNQTPKGIAEILSKWYGMDAPRFFNGADKMSPAGYGPLKTSLTLQEMLHLLRRDDVDFQIAGRSIHVTRK